MPHLELLLADLLRALQIPASQALFEEAIEDDEEISRSHLLDPELRYPVFAVDPGIGHDSVSVTAYNRLQRQLYGQIEMLGKKRLDASDHSPPIHLECIRDIIAGDAKE